MNVEEALENRLQAFVCLLGLCLLFYGLGWLFWKRKGDKTSLSEYLTRSCWILSAPILYLLDVGAFLLFLPGSVPAILQVGVQFFLTYVIYSLLLLAWLPLLRRRYLAACCAALWVLPSLAFFFLCYLPYVLLLCDPVVRIFVRRKLAFLLLCIWAVGFLGVLGWKLLSHQRFRRRILLDAVPAPTKVRQVYRQMCSELNGKQAGAEFIAIPAERPLTRDPTISAMQIGAANPEEPICVPADIERYLESPRHRFPQEDQVLLSPTAESPLAIGLFRRTVRIVLPMREYTVEELRLIFRHELCHLVRDDNRAKLFMTLQTAFGWFLPTMWLGMERSAQDMELACDEMATERLPEEERKAYAALLLNQAGQAQGFTTCLSASASGLRYRLQRVLHPTKRRSGILLLCLVLALFLSCFTLADFAVEVGTMRQTVFDRYPDAAFEIKRDASSDWTDCADPELLHEALDGILLYQDIRSENILGKSVFNIRLSDSAELTVYDRYIYFHDRQLVTEDGKSWHTTSELYLLKEPVDWTKVEALYPTAENTEE